MTRRDLMPQTEASQRLASDLKIRAYLSVWAVENGFASVDHLLRTIEDQAAQESRRIRGIEVGAAVRQLSDATAALMKIADLPPAMGPRSDAMELLDEAKQYARDALSGTEP